MRDRLTIPLLLPLLGVGAILLTIFSFGYLLIEVTEVGRDAWVVGIVVAAAILLIAAFINWQPSLRGWPLYALTAAPASVILAVGLFYLVRPAPSVEGGPEVAVIPPPGPIQQVATDNRFSNTSFTIEVNQQYQLTLENRGTALHNWVVRGVTNTNGQPIETQLLQGGQSETITFTIGQVGEYQFLCTVHPVEMVGRLNVVAEGTSASAGPGGGSAGGGSPGPGTIVSIATDNRFNPQNIVANANEPTTLSLENRGVQIHNLRVQNVTGTNGQPIQTRLLPGGQSETIQFTIAQPGSYPYICDVHPTEMRGTLTVR
jgi:plastocyanin